MHLAAFDLDKTLITINSSFYFCDFLYRNHLLTLTEKALCIYSYLQFRFLGLPLKRLHERVFEFVFLDKQVDLLKHHVEPFIDILLKNFLYIPAIKRLEACRKENHFLLLLSNSPDFIVSEFAKRLGFDVWKATRYTVNSSGKLEAIAEIFDGHAKKKFYLEFAKGNNVPYHCLSAYSDSYLDLPFLESAAHSVAVNPDRKLRRIAENRLWEII